MVTPARIQNTILIHVYFQKSVGWKASERDWKGKADIGDDRMQATVEIGGRWQRGGGGHPHGLSKL